MPITFDDAVAASSGTAEATYADQSDLENRFGTENILKWSNLDPSETTADTDRIQLALDFADAEIENYFGSSRYTIPFTGYSAGDNAAVKLREWAVVLAGFWLYSSRGLQDESEIRDKLTDMRDEVMDEMAKVRAGVVNLGATERFPSYPAVPVSV